MRISDWSSDVCSSELRMSVSVVVDLSRMNGVLDIDGVSGPVLVEPGVRFSDLHTAVRDSGVAFWTSAPDLSWGSVVGNALERGLGYTAYGEHAAQVCGLEVVLPDGEVVRTDRTSTRMNSSH